MLNAFAYRSFSRSWLEDWAESTVEVVPLGEVALVCMSEYSLRSEPEGSATEKERRFSDTPCVEGESGMALPLFLLMRLTVMLLERISVELKYRFMYAVLPCTRMVWSTILPTCVNVVLFVRLLLLALLLFVVLLLVLFVVLLLLFPLFPLLLVLLVVCIQNPADATKPLGQFLKHFSFKM